MTCLKLKKNLSGIGGGGGDCIICEKQIRRMWKESKKHYLQAEETQAIFEQLLLVGDGEIVKSRNIYKHWLPIEPKTTSDQHSHHLAFVHQCAHLVSKSIVLHF